MFPPSGGWEVGTEAPTPKGGDADREAVPNSFHLWGG